MESQYSVKRAAAAILMAAVIAFSVPINIAVSETAAISNEPLAQNSADTAFLNTSTVPKSSTTQKEPEAPEPGTDNKYTQEETMPGNDTSLTPDDILPDNDDSITEIGGGYTEKNGVTVIPATVNNIIRDSLPSIISKKVYTFSLSSRGTIMYAFNHVESTGKQCIWYITLYEEFSPDGTGKTVDYRILNRITYETVGTGVQSPAIGVLPGNYRLEIECISGYTEDKYDTVIGFIESAFYEAEPNDTNSRYNELPLNKTINGSASSLPDDKPDTDCYLFRITDIGYTVLYFEHEADPSGSTSNVAWRISITDEHGNEYFHTSSTMDKALINSGIMGLAPGYYFVTVNSHMRSDVPYSLNVSFTEDTSIEKELNETPETATPIGINTEIAGSVTLRNDISDRDYYSFSLEKDGFIVIDFIHEAMTEDNDGWNVSVLSADGKTIFSSISKWNQAALKSPNIGLTAGDYFIKIDSDGIYHNSMAYRLVLLTVLNTNWETEPNNTPVDADTLEFGSSVNGTMIETGVDYDRDWYTVTVSEEKTLTVSFGHITTEEAGKEGWTISIIDKAGNMMNTMSSAWDEEEKSVSVNVSAGSYYILIETGLYFNSNRYILTVN